MGILVKLFSVILIAALAMGCSNNDNDDELLDTTPEVVVVPEAPAVPHTLYLSSDTLSAADPDEASSALADAAAFPAVVEFLDVAASSYADDFDVSVTGALQDYDSVLDTGLLGDNATASPGHIIYGALKLLWSRGLETRKDFYANVDLESAAPVTEITLDDRFISWDAANGTLRSVYVGATDNVRHATDVIVDDDFVALTYTEESPFGKTLVNVVKTDADIQISGIMSRNSFPDVLFSGSDANSTGYQDSSYYGSNDDITMFFTARITDTGLAIRFCSLEDGRSYSPSFPDCDRLDDDTMHWQYMCNDRAAYVSAQSSYNSTKACVQMRWYHHPTDASSLTEANSGLDGSTRYTDVEAYTTNNDSGIAVDPPTIGIASFWDATVDEFRFSL